MGLCGVAALEHGIDAFLAVGNLGQNWCVEESFVSNSSKI